MKNKKLLYILIPATIVIWAAIAINIISNLNRKGNIEEYNYIPKVTTQKDSTDGNYTLLANYRDPFNYRIPVATKPKEESNKQVNSKPRVQRSMVRRTRISWPGIDYFGIIDSENARVALLTVNTKRHIIKEGDLIEEMKIVKLYSDSLLIEFKGEQKSFIKNKTEL